MRKKEDSSDKERVVIIGGGWGGWGAAKRLCEYYSSTATPNVTITLIDALPDPTGSTPYLTPTGKPFEAGTRGFWYDYPNINRLLKTLNLRESDVFTDYTNSSFYSPDGLEATAPVFSKVDLQLPSPLGQVLATFPLFERLPLSDRASMVGLLLATVDCLGSPDESVRIAYDKITGDELFRRFNLSPRLVRDFMKPTLLVGLFKPPEELSALVVMELLYYYALAHQDSFDVRWIKNGTVADSLISPLASHLVEEYGLEVMGGCRVGEVKTTADGKVESISYTKGKAKKVEKIASPKGVVMALGNNGLKSVVKSSPSLSTLPTFARAMNLKSVDVISVRLWFDKIIPTRTPANVFSRFPSLRGAGGTFFMLDQFQGNTKELWGGEEPKGSVVACDFYNSGELMGMKDEEIVSLLTSSLLPSAVPSFATAQTVDTCIYKYPSSVTHFSPSSYTSRPPLMGDPMLPTVKFAGDVVRMGELEHGAKGLCQERAFVSGMRAGEVLVKEIEGKDGVWEEEVLEVREDEKQFVAAAKVNEAIQKRSPINLRSWLGVDR